MARKTVPTTRIHPVTGKILRRGEREMAVEYKGFSRTVTVKGWFPDDDSDGVMWRDDGAAADRALVEMKAEHARYVSEITRKVEAELVPILKRVVAGMDEGRKRLAGKKGISYLLTGSPNSLSKYAQGTATPSHPTLVLMSLLLKDPELLAEIAKTPPNSGALRNGGRAVSLRAPKNQNTETRP
jgi:hypothetical protein